MNGWTVLGGLLLLMAGVGAGFALGRARPRGAAPPASGVELAALLAPAGQALARVERGLADVERQRVGAYAGLSEQVAALHRSTAELGAQAHALAGALRSPTVRGRWGEMQLRRVVEVAGLVEHCDFDVQRTFVGPAGRQRPDLVVRLAGGRCVPVDAKVPLDAWLAAQQAGSAADHRQLLAAHARALRAQVDALAAKAYWELFAPTPEFVVLFVPADALLDGALAADPGLLEHALARSVVLATPSTLIALLRTVAFGWKQEQLATSVEEIRRLGRDLYARLGTAADHLVRMGSGLQRAVEAYNAGVGSLEGRVMVAARRFADLGVEGDGIAPVTALRTAIRQPRADDGDPTVRRIP